MAEKPTRIDRRRAIAGAASAGALLVLPGKAPAQSNAKPLTGVTLNVACWSSPYAKALTDYIGDFEALTGAKVNYETPAFPIYNQRADIELAYKRMDQVHADKGYAGPVVVCMALYRPIAGHRPERSAIKYLVAQRDMELCDRMVKECFASADYTEGRTAFMEKRRPVFKGS